MEPKEDRWFVRFRGHTLGPLTNEQIKISLRQKELGPEDKLASAKNPAWRSLREVPEFHSFWETITPALLKPLPPPQFLWRKKRAPLPPAPQAPIPEKTLAPTATVAVNPAEVKQKAAPLAPARTSVGKAKKPKAKTKPKRAIAAPSPSPSRAAKATPAPVAALKKITIARRVPLAGKFPSLAPSPAAAPETLPAPEKLAAETLSLLETLRDWSQKEAALHAAVAPARAPLKTQLDSSIPPKPAMPEPAPTVWAPPQTSSALKLKSEKIELHLTLSRKFLAAFALVAILAVTAIALSLTDAIKMRGLEGFRPLSPSSPELSPKNDPIPSLKAPTRPKRE